MKNFTGISNLFCFFGCFLLFAMVSCTKDISREIHENAVITGNSPPPFDGVSDVQLQSYINSFYIDLIGRGPTQVELESATSIMRSSELDPEVSDSILISIQSTWEYYKNYDAQTRQRMLAAVDSQAIADLIFDFDQKVQNYNAAGDTILALFFQFATDDLILLQSAGPDLYAGNIDYNEYFRRMILNFFYDEVNMGTENFVLATFENLFFRAPSAQELSESESMVDGNPAFLFLEDGSTKRDFTDICVHSSAFYEGLVKEVYTNLLARDPDSYETFTGTDLLLSDGDYAALQRIIIKSAEYADF